MGDVDNRLRAENELIYRIKQIANGLRRNNPNLSEQEAMAIAKQEVKQEIELRAYLIYRATKDYTLDNWLQAEQECRQMPDFDSKING